MSKLYDLEEWEFKKRIIGIIKDFPWEFLKTINKGRKKVSIETPDFIITIKKRRD